MKKLLISILACLPMLGFADFRMQLNPNSVTLVNMDTRFGYRVSAISSTCLNVDLDNRTVSSVLPVPVMTTTLAGAQGTCELNKPIEITIVVGDIGGTHGPWGVFSLELEHGRFATGKNLRTLHTTEGISFDFERNRTQNIIYIHPNLDKN